MKLDNNEIVRQLSIDYAKEVLDGKKLTISQKLYYPMFIDYIAYKVYNYRLKDSSGEHQEIKYLHECALKYIDYFPELFI